MNTQDQLSLDNQSIDQTFAEWADAVRNGDIETLVSLITEDAEFWTHGLPAISGREAVIPIYKTLFENYKLEQRFESKERCIAGDWAFERGIEKNTVTPRNGGAPVEKEQRAFMILRRCADGRWRYARGMTNLASQPAGS